MSLIPIITTIGATSPLWLPPLISSLGQLLRPIPLPAPEPISSVPTTITTTTNTAPKSTATATNAAINAARGILLGRTTQEELNYLASLSNDTLVQIRSIKTGEIRTVTAGRARGLIAAGVATLVGVTIGAGVIEDVSQGVDPLQAIQQNVGNFFGNIQNAGYLIIIILVLAIIFSIIRR